MICTAHSDARTGGTYITLHRQSWREWFVWEISDAFYYDKSGMVQLKATFGCLWHIYVPIRHYYSATRRMTLAPIAAGIFAWRGIKAAWFFPARILYELGWLAGLKSGETVHWFWFRYLGKEEGMS